jgi:hypothetical protein
MQGSDFVLPVYVERNPRNGNLFFRLSPGSRKRTLPRDPRSAEFNRAYHAALADAGEQNDLDDWSELEILYAQQRAAPGSQPVTIERLERALVICAAVMERDGPALAPLYLSLERDLALLQGAQHALERAKAMAAKLDRLV